MDDELEQAHSSLGPSRAHMYRRCPGAPNAERGLPDTAGIDAAHGTVFHEFAALALEFDLDPFLFVGAKMEVGEFGQLEFTREMATKMQPGLRIIRALLASAPDAEMFVETRLDLSRWLGRNQFGTSDVCIIIPSLGLMVVFDWKWGAGVPVSPEENDQAILYTLGCWEAHSQKFYDWYLENTDDPDIYSMPDVKVKIIIEQPRAEGGGGVWDTTMTHVLAVGDQIKMDADATRDPDAPRIPGPKQCKFCKAAKFNTCPERAKFLLESIGSKFDDLEDGFTTTAPLDLYDRRALTPEQRAQILLHKSMIESFLEGLHAEAYADAEAGRPTPRQKLVDGRRPARAWKDPKKAEIVVRQVLGDAAFKVSMLSPSQVQEEIGKDEYNEIFAPFVDQGEAKPILVPDTDKRPARASHGDKYDMIENETLI